MTVVGSFWNGMKTQTPSETVKHLGQRSPFSQRTHHKALWRNW